MDKWLPLRVDRQRVESLWAALQAFPEILRQLGTDSLEEFVRALGEPRNVFMDIGPGVGMVAALDVVAGHDARVVFVGFDQHVQSHAAAFRGAVYDIMVLGGLRRVTAYTPMHLPVLVKLLTRKLGFVWEGVQRDGWAPGVDVMVNGCLRAELEATCSS